MSGGEDYKTGYDGVRVSAWFMAKGLQDSRRDFRCLLGTEFIPAIVQLMSPQGLTAFISSVIPDDSCEEVPDETEIIFFSSYEVYQNRTRTTGGRLFGNGIHQVVFDLDENTPFERRSFTEFPQLMENDLWIKTPYYLVDNKVDWMKGRNTHYIGVREDSSQSVSEFLDMIHTHMAVLQNNMPSGLEGFLFVITNKCLIYWANWSSPKLAKSTLLYSLRQKLRKVLNTISQPTEIPTSTKDNFKGLTLDEGDSISTQFKRCNPPDYMYGEE
ncbi:MAG: hypothetical protein HQL71_08210 [Magnetococcales bacterium]|nr:hypothetical protein [Magnetococcales bacterium]